MFAVPLWSVIVPLLAILPLNVIKAGSPAAGPVALTESWNGSSWTEKGDLATARHYVGSAGTATAGFAIGGDGNLTSTEEFSDPATSTVSFTVS